MSDSNFIHVSGLSHRYARTQTAALSDIELQIPEGCSFGLLGPNGAGKTTLLSVLMGLITPQTGDITIGGHSTKHQAEHIRAISALVPQDLAFYARLTGYENLQFFARIYGIADSQWQQRLDYCTRVCQLQDMLARRVAEYSGGMKRRLNLAIGLLNSPKILYLDEPTVGIDALSRQVIIAAIQTLRTQGTTIIYTSHYMEEVEAICDELAIINHGRLVARGRTQQLRQQGSEKILSLTFATIPSADLLQAIQRWNPHPVHERKFELTLADANDMTRVLDTCTQHHIIIEQLQYGVNRLEQTYLSLLKANAAPESEAAT
jgi:ABC-2 type transport system ATP-binding protein